MCTAINYTRGGHIFGRTLDYEYSYGESVVVVPKEHPLHFIYEGTMGSHPAIIGMAHVSDGRALFYDAMNESGLCMAALNFPILADYKRPSSDKINLASFEVITYILSHAESVSDALTILNDVNVTSDSAAPNLMPTPLHYILADRLGAVTIEPCEFGLMIYDNPLGVLTNSPSFDYHMLHLTEYMRLSPTPPENKIAPRLPIIPYSRGMGAIGLPGDYSSGSRFIRAAYAKENTEPSGSAVIDFFHVISTVEVPSGLSTSEDSQPVRTIYTSAIDTERKIYYYKTYSSLGVTAIHMDRCELDGERLQKFPLIDAPLNDIE